MYCLQDVGQLQQQNGELRGMALQLQSRLEEESEVVSALRAQLVDYKLQVRCCARVGYQRTSVRRMHARFVHATTAQIP
jgi:hypothetical protein